MADTDLTQAQRDALEYYTRRDQAPNTALASHEPKTGTIVALIRRGLLLPLGHGRTQHELTDAGWAAAERLDSPTARPKRRPNGLADQVVNQVHAAVGGMWPLSSVGAEEVDAVIRKTVATALVRITCTGIGAGTRSQVDARLRELAQEIGG